MTPQTSITAELLRAAQNALPIEIGPVVELLLPGLIQGQYIVIADTKVTPRCNVIRARLTAKGKAFLATLGTTPLQ